MPMESAARQFSCALCRKEITLCRSCDRGNIYCGTSCAKAARKASLRCAGQKYQQKRQGKHKHAQRQKKYYLSRRKKIASAEKMLTHQGSQRLLMSDLLIPTISKTIDGRGMPTITDESHCHVCGAPCLPMDFL
jgi:hypothetical protein